MRCLTPSLIKRPDGFRQNVPCGHCVHCVVNRQLAWTLRIVLEASTCAQNSFVTLTYAEDMRPGRLPYQHVQQFLRRLRKSSQGPVRFFCVGEYGKRTGREHWHLILFRTPPLELEGSLTRLWSQNGMPRGFGSVGSVTRASAMYVAKYSLKSGAGGDNFCARMSRRPGIGLDAIRQIGRYLAERTPRIPVLPCYWRLGGTFHPLDKSARLALGASYEENGGVVEEKRSALSLDHEARLFALVNDPSEVMRRQAVDIQRIEVRDRATF